MGIAIAAMLGLVACGGGSGGSSPEPVASPPPTPTPVPDPVPVEVPPAEDPRVLMPPVSSPTPGDGTGPAFAEVTDAAGVAYTGKSFGAAWGDANGDGWPDLWVSNHGDAPSIFLNAADGSFEESRERIVNLAAIEKRDTHGAAWADFDRDGDDDLLISVGGEAGAGTGGNLLLISDGERFVESAAIYGLDDKYGRGRSPFWFDRDDDGELDVLLATWRRDDGMAPTRVFAQADGRFSPLGPQFGLITAQDNNFARQIWLGNIGQRGLLLHTTGRFPDGVFTGGRDVFTPIATALSGEDVWDLATGDFDGNLLSDVYLARLRTTTYAAPEGETAIWSKFSVTNTERGFSFRASGEVSFSFLPERSVDLAEIYIGETGVVPTAHAFSIAPGEPAAVGLLPHAPGSDRGIYIGTDGDDRYTVLVSAVSAFSFNLVVEADGGLTDFEGINLPGDNGELPDALFLQTDSDFVDATSSAGLGDAGACESAVSADFDNDGDLDLYLVCRGQTLNLPNRLYDNQGNGHFEERFAHGAEGARAGRGDVAVAADYDRDGFVDVFVTNGRLTDPYNRGPSQLFRNTGNSNHWLGIDLRGIVSNVHGIGARVFVSAGDRVQLREATGGVRRAAQDHGRLHFGLGGVSRVDRIEVHWPTGQVQAVADVPANQVIDLVQQLSPQPAGAPDLQAGVDEGLYLWFESSDQTWRLRASHSASARYDITILSDAALAVIAEDGVDRDTQLSLDGRMLSVQLTPASDTRGIDFTANGATRIALGATPGTTSARGPLAVGPDAEPMTPNAVLVDWEQFPAQLPPRVFAEPALLISRSDEASQLAFNWSSDRNAHDAYVDVLSASTILSMTPFGFDATDVASAEASRAVLSTRFRHADKGAVIATTAPGPVVLRYLQDGLQQPSRLVGLPRPQAWMLVLDESGAQAAEAASLN